MRLSALVAFAAGLSACSPTPEYVHGADHTWIRGEQIGFKRQYTDAPGMVACIRARLSREYAVDLGLSPHGLTWILTLTQRGSRIVEAEYIGTRLADGIVDVEWRRTRRPYDNVADLTKAAEDILQRCSGRPQPF